MKFTLLERLLRRLGLVKAPPRRRKKKRRKHLGSASPARLPLSTPRGAGGGGGLDDLGANPDVAHEPAFAPVQTLIDGDDSWQPDPVQSPALVAGGGEMAEPHDPLPVTPPSGALARAVATQDQAELMAALEGALSRARVLLQVVQQKREMLATQAGSFDRAAQMRDYPTLAFLGATLVIDSAFFRDDLLTMAQQAQELGDKIAATPIKKVKELVGSWDDLAQQFDALLDKKLKMVDMLAQRLEKAHQNKDFTALSDLSGALSRDAMILAALEPESLAAAGSGQTGLTATSSAEKISQVNQQMIQVAQAVLDRKFAAIADLARLISLNSGVLADPNVNRASQIVQLATQLQQGLKQQPNHPGHAMQAANLGRTAGQFNGLLMEKAGQLEGQVSQLKSAIEAFDMAKLFPLAVSISRSAAILTDSAIQKASLVAGYASRIDVSVKRQDIQGALHALRQALS
jgi:hypothetical protein